MHVNACTNCTVCSCSNVTQEMLQSRVKFEDSIKMMLLEDQDFYNQIEGTDMFSAFCQSRRCICMYMYLCMLNTVFKLIDDQCFKVVNVSWESCT